MRCLCWSSCCCHAFIQERRRLPWFCIGHSVRVCQPCQLVIDSGEYERGVVERHQQRVEDLRSIVQAGPVHAEAELKESSCLLADAVPATVEATAIDESEQEDRIHKHPN